MSVSQRAGAEDSASSATAETEAVSPQPGAEDSASAPTLKNGAVDTQVELFLAAIRSDDAEGIAAAFDRLGELQGPASNATIVAALEATGLTEAMLAALTKRSEALHTALAWSQLAAAAAAVGRDALAVKAAGTALETDPATPNAAFILSVAANRQGKHDETLRVIADIDARVPGAKNDPYFVVQTAIAEIGRNQPTAALAVIDAALPRLTAAGLEFDAHLLRGRALVAIGERSADAVRAWERAFEVAAHPVQIDHARDGLIAALWQAKRYDESLRQLDLGLTATTNDKQRSAWIEARVNVLVAKGDVDGALAAYEDLLAITTEPERRLQLRVQQARVVAGASRWKEAATRFDAALAEISTDAADASKRRHAIQLEKVQMLASREIDLVLADLDELDATWPLPGWPAPINLRVGGLLQAGRASEALTWLEERLARTPELADHPAAHYLRGEAELKLGHTDEAMREYGRAIDVAPTVEDPLAWFATLASGVSSGQWKAAIRAYQRLVELNPDSASDPTLRVLAAQAYLRIDEPETALKLTDNAEPTSLQLLGMRDTTRGEAQIRLGQFEEVLATTGAALKRYQATTEVPPIFLLSLHLLRAQAFNQQEKFEAARDAASAAIDVPDDPGVPFEGMTAFMRIGAYSQRSLALYKLGDKAKAHRDVDAAIASFERNRNSAIVRVLERAPEFERFETQLWYAKGAVLTSESRSEEALAAYTRSEQLEKHGAAAAIARGYALSSTGAFNEAMTAFDIALARVSSPQERADAFAGKGRALIRLGRYEEAITALQSALDARLTEPDDDPVVFEHLGIAYNSLQRNGAANRAFRRAWELTDNDKRSANLARGVIAAELRLGDPAAALEFLDDLPARLADDRTLQFNRALALDSLGRRRAAIRFLVRAKDAGLDRAQVELDRLDAPAGLGRWTHYWFGGQARQTRRAFGIALVIIAATALAAPLFQWWLNAKFDWYLLLLPSVVALLLLALPNMKSITIEAGKVKLSAEPLPATGREAAAVAAPESFNVTMLGTVPVTTTDSKFP